VDMFREVSLPGVAASGVSGLGQSRSTQCFQPRVIEEEERLLNRMIELACSYGRYGYRRIMIKLQEEGWQVSHKRG